MDHFITGPSCADEWSRCKAYLQMRRSAPEQEDSPAAVEGRVAHFFSEEAIQCGHFDVSEFIGREESGITVDSEMAQYCNIYTQRVKQIVDICRILGVEVEYRTEYRVDLSWVYPGFFGTRDFHCIAIFSNWAIVADLKYGRVGVDAEDCRQLMCYALDIVHKHPSVEWVRFEIVQPRGRKANGPIDVAYYHRDQLMAFAGVAREYQEANHSTEIQTPTAGPHCVYCPGRGMCLANMQRVIELAPPVKFNPNIITAEKVEELLSNKKLIANFLDSAYVWGLNLAQRGTTFRTQKMVRVKSREAFPADLKPEDAAEAIRLMTGKPVDLDEIAPRRMGPISTIREKYGDAVVAALTKTPTEKLELRDIKDAGTPVQSNMMAALNEPIRKLETDND